jgi:hypothetical protein
LAVTQLDLLGQEKASDLPLVYHFPALFQFHKDFEFLNAALRMLSRPLLLVNVLLLSITWVGKALRMQAHEPSANDPQQIHPAASPQSPSIAADDTILEKRIAFTKVWAKGIVVQFTLPMLGLHAKEVRLTHAVGKALYVLARDRMQGIPTVTGANSKEFNNFSEELKRVVKALADEGIQLTADDLIESAGTAKKTFKFKPEEIVIAEEVRATFDHKTTKA